PPLSCLLAFLFFLSSSSCAPLDLPSFPTRRSSDLRTGVSCYPCPGGGVPWLGGEGRCPSSTARWYRSSLVGAARFACAYFSLTRRTYCLAVSSLIPRRRATDLIGRPVAYSRSGRVSWVLSAGRSGASSVAKM